MAEDWIAGKNPVMEALKAKGPIKKIWVASTAKSQLDEVEMLAREQGVTVEVVPKQTIQSLAQGVTHQGVLAFVPPFSYAQMDQIWSRAKRFNQPLFVLILDQIEDPHNLGSMIRTAEAAGVHGVIIPKRRAAGVTPTVVKSSAGAVEYLPIVQVTNVSRTIEELKKQHVWIFGTAAEAAQDYRQEDYKIPLALVIGSEGNGMSRIVREKCDFMIKMPLTGHIQSLNASVAAGLLMYEVHRQRFPLEQGGS